MKRLKRFWRLIKNLDNIVSIHLVNDVWKPCHIYETATVGTNNSIGRFAEVGDKVVIGNNNRIGAYAFIPHGVVIGSDCFIGPRVTFTNDKYPPSGEKNWEYIIVEDRASIGAGCVILPGITIGEGALIGAGSVVTHNVPAGEKWVGSPAKKIGMRVMQ